MTEQLFNSQILTHLILSFLFFVLIVIIRKSIIFRINNRVENVNLRHNYRKLTVYIWNVIYLVILGVIWVKKINVGIVLSIIGAGVVISLADIILSFAGWLFITVRKPFVVGERIQVGSVKGDVVDIRAFYTTMLEIGGWVEEEQSTGRIVQFPNSFIFRNPIYNYTKGFDFIWDEIKITITFESNYKKAREICLKYLDEFHNSWAKDLDRKIRRAQNIYAIHYDKLTPTVYVRVADSGVVLSLRYLVEPQKRRFSENFLYEKILDEFSQAADINFAYTTYRITQ